MAGPGAGFADFRIWVDDGGSITWFAQRFATWGQSLTDLSPAWAKIGQRLMGDFRANFAAQGGMFTAGRGAGWQPLKPSTVRERLRLGFGAGPIMMRTGRLVDSLADPGAAGNVFEVSADHVTVGSDVEYAGYQHFGAPGRNLPARKLIGLSWDTRSYALAAVADLVRERARNAGFEIVD